MGITDRLAEFEADLQVETGLRAVEYFPHLPGEVKDVVSNRQEHIAANKGVYEGRPMPLRHAVLLFLAGGYGLWKRAHENKKERVRFRRMIAERMPEAMTRTAYEQAFGSALQTYGLERFLMVESDNLAMHDKVFSWLSGFVKDNPEQQAFVSQTARVLRRWQEEYSAVVSAYCQNS